MDPATLRTSEQLLRALDTHGWRLDDIVAMDEYTLDWVVSTPDGWLVFDTT